MIDRLARDDGPPSAVAELVLAAAEGSDAVDAHLSGGPAPARRTPTGAGKAAEPARVYREQIGVQDFRGIGPASRLQFADVLDPRIDPALRIRDP